MDLEPNVEAADGVVALLSQSLIAMSSGMLSYFINFLLDDHPLGRWWLKKIQQLPTNWAKPLGECPYCSAGWQYLGVCLLISHNSIGVCLVFLGLNFFVVRLLIPPQR
jgi:hypothetical protein